MSTSTRHQKMTRAMTQELMEELLKARPDRVVVRDRARRLGYKSGDDIEALMAEVLEKAGPRQKTNPKRPKRPAGEAAP